MTCLKNVDAIVHIKMTLLFDQEGKFVVQHIKEKVSCMSVGGPYCKNCRPGA
jgi:hypothetical protein